MTPESREPGGMERLSVRLPRRTLAQLDTLAAERGITRTRVVRQLLDAGLIGRPAPSTEPPSEAELSRCLASGHGRATSRRSAACWRAST
jgi:hypothetical protein